MFVEIHGPLYKCSQCGAVGSDELVIRRHQKLRRCMVCGHVSVIEDLRRDEDKTFYASNDNYEIIEF